MGDYSWHLSLRIDQPIEGCEISPHAYVKIQSITMDNSSKAKVLDSHPHTFVYRWSRSPNVQSCCNNGCSRQNSNDPMFWSSFARGGPILQCAVCEKAGLPKYQALFCSTSCFKNAWKLHSAKHRQAKTLNLENIEYDLDVDVVADALDESYVEDVLEPSKHADIIHGGGTEWIPIHNSTSSYVPTRDDVGHVLRVECTVISSLVQDEVLAGPIVAYSYAVLSQPRINSRKSLTTVPGAINNSVSTIQHRFRIISYNILAEVYATRQAYPYCDPWNLTWPYRRTLIIQEIIDTQGDIICLQEVQADHFENTFQQIMSDLGYDGLFKQKTRESMGQHGKVDGCAMFWKRSKFMLVENYTIEFNECARRSALQLGLEDSDLHRYVSRLSKDNIAQVVILEALPRASRPRAGGGGTQPAPNHICIVNTHLYSNHTRPEVKLWQTLTLMREIEPYVVQQDLALLICGDFNSEPLSAVYEFLNHGYVNENHEELVEDTANPLLPDTEHVVHSLDLASAMATALGEEPSFTNYTKNFRGTLDYMWYTPSRLKVLAVSNIPDESEVIQYGEALPNVCYPSDHLLLCCDLLLTASSGNNSVNAMRNNRTNGLKMGGQQLSQNSAMQSMVGVSPGPKSKGGQPLRR